MNGLFLALCGLLLVGSVVGLHDYHIYSKCNYYGQKTGKAVEYRPFDTCYVESGGRFMRWDEYKAYLKGGGK
ncbi:hypothetical protein [Alcanivorax sp.]|uniref:hypothetical protein n=1 Tax=Alcanivorax sp. TaxID=1872427 RepID=UPI000C0F3CA5|nr:hypothetical protein [Alcanivorax sp.]PHR67960.1 MAG: hypothetical protein COA55_03545 [Alcanivorax sp.]